MVSWTETRKQQLDAVTGNAIQAYRDWCPSVGIDEKPHQIKGLQWCLYHELVEKPNAGVRGGIIADEMGLGKTILMIGCIRHNFKQRTLVVVPPALLSLWVAVFKRFLGHTPFVYRGSAAKNITVENLAQKPIVLTTYGMITPRGKGRRRTVEKTFSKLHGLQWSRIIYDEAHHLRNLGTGVHHGAANLKADIRWMVTGTPINNRITDLYALCRIIGLAEVFTPNKEEIKRLLGIHLLRRTKTQVGIKLPPVNTKVIEVDWSSESEEDMAAQVHAMMNFTGGNHGNVDQLIAYLNRHHCQPSHGLARCASIHSCSIRQLLR